MKEYKWPIIAGLILTVVVHFALNPNKLSKASAWFGTIFSFAVVVIALLLVIWLWVSIQRQRHEKRERQPALLYIALVFLGVFVTTWTAAIGWSNDTDAHHVLVWLGAGAIIWATLMFFLYLINPRRSS